MRQAHLEQLVMDMFAISRENRPSTDQPPQDRQRGFQNRQAKGHNRNRDRHQGGSLLSPGQCQRAQHKSDEQAPGISEKDRCWIKVKPQKSQNCSGQGHAHQRTEP